MGFVYRIASPSEYLAITGYGVDDVKLAKKAWIAPGQRCARFDISPVNYTFEVQAMSAEKLPFVLPAVFTIGPRADDVESLLRYAKLISPHDKLSRHVNELVKGVIEGETRVLAASMTMEQIFHGTKSFKQAVFESVQLELNQFGLIIYNANVKQLVDVPGHEYFSYLGQKTQQEAVNQAKVDVAEARMKGEVGAKERKGMTRQNAAKVDAETKVYTVKRQGEGSKEELAMKKAGWEQQARVAEVEAAKAVAIRDAQLQVEVERTNAARQTEKLKAEHLSKAVVDYEMKVQQANWELYNRQKAAEALLFEQERQAEARRAMADAEFFARQREAEAELYAKRKEAEGLAAMGEAQSVYLSSMLGALGGSYGALRDYLMISSGVYQEMARINADAIKGLEPKISVWSNGSASEGGDGAMKEMAGVYRMLPPLLTTVHEQTGMLPPAWMGTLKGGTSTST
uniref:Flotillin-like n=1 Tax=Aegilops tauschii subsp. strangulata TaxID=200361 RepID=A0A453NGL4_AEGTS